MKNLSNIKKVLDHIETNPHLWEQRDWHCGTSHCFAGWAEVFATGEKVLASKTRQVARIFFGFNAREADYYFDPFRTLDELKTALESFFDENGMGRDGYDIDGYDRDGYNRDGFDRDGFDRDGFDRYGYDRDGYDINGYDLDDLDRNNNPKPFYL